MKKRCCLILVILFVALVGCEKANNKTTAPTDSTESSSESEQIEVTDNTEDTEATEDRQNHKDYMSGDVDIDESINSNLKIGDGEEFQFAEWVDEEKTVFHIALQFIEQPENEYQHSRDYLFVKDKDGSIISFDVDYPSKKDYDADRYVNDACGFDVQYMDVNFDGEKDILIFLGYITTAGSYHNCAYIYQDGDFVYTPSFEQIACFELLEDEQLIEGSYNSGGEHVVEKYEYQDGEFVMVSEERESY